MKTGSVDLTEIAAIPRGTLVIVTWHDIQAEINGDPDDAELFARQSAGFFHELRRPTGCPAYIVMTFDLALDGNQAESGWQAIPAAVIALIETVGGETTGAA